MAPHSSTLAWKIPWMEEPGGLRSPWCRWESDTIEGLHFHFSLSCIGEGNGNPLQCSCLENPGDGGAWWAAVYGVTQSRTRLKWLSRSKEVAKIKRAGGSSDNESTCQSRRCVKDISWISGLGRSSRVGSDNHSGILAWKISWTEEPG